MYTHVVVKLIAASAISIAALTGATGVTRADSTRTPHRAQTEQHVQLMTVDDVEYPCAPRSTAAIATGQATSAGT